MSIVIERGARQGVEGPYREPFSPAGTRVLQARASARDLIERMCDGDLNSPDREYVQVKVLQGISDFAFREGGAA